MSDPFGSAFNERASAAPFVEVSFQLDRSDYDVAVNYVQARRQTRFIAFLQKLAVYSFMLGLAAVVFVLVGITWRLLGDFNWIGAYEPFGSVVLFIFIGGLLTWVYSVLFRLAYRSRSVDLYPAFKYQTLVRVNEFGVWSINFVGADYSSWSAIDRIELTSSGLFILLITESAIFIPKRSFDGPDEVEAFHQFARAMKERHTSEAAGQAAPVSLNPST